MRQTVRAAAVAAAVIVGAGSAVVTRAIAQQNQNFDAVQMDVQVRLRQFRNELTRDGGIRHFGTRGD